MARYKLGDIDNERFYMIPKSFFVCDEYRDMGLTAKVLYGVLHDRMELSRRNGWVDEDGAIFMIYTVDNLVSVLGVDRKTIFKAMNELKEKELLEAKRQGQGQPNKLYLHKMKPVDVSEVPKKDSRSTEKGTREVPKSGTSRSGENGTLMILSSSDTKNSDTENSVCGAEAPPEDTSPEKPKKSPSRKKFIPPTLEEVKEYVREKRLNVDPDKFFEYYEAGDWHDGNGKPVKAWKQKCLTWDRHDSGGRRNTQPSQSQSQIVDTDIDWSKYDG